MEFLWNYTFGNVTQLVNELKNNNLKKTKTDRLHDSIIAYIEISNMPFKPKKL